MGPSFYDGDQKGEPCQPGSLGWSRGKRGCRWQLDDMLKFPGEQPGGLPKGPLRWVGIINALSVYYRSHRSKPVAELWWMAVESTMGCGSRRYVGSFPGEARSMRDNSGGRDNPWRQGPFSSLQIFCNGYGFGYPAIYILTPWGSQ